MRYITKEQLINAVFNSDADWNVKDGYCKHAETAINPIIAEYEERIKSAVKRELYDIIRVSETWSEAVKKLMPPEQTKEYVQGYNDAVAEIRDRVNALIEYIEHPIDKAINNY